ncbi:protein-S-isoprenylcysteine methyltransferase [Photobacterium sp. GB-72]|nr:protein-S-isoprenylcysteine methyltransferase [Photobacterium sp. GB-72]PSV34349.1 protein-S-isoprenylcysteine methyltransferase [Photobacterium sp. GB-210]
MYCYAYKENTVKLEQKIPPLLLTFLFAGFMKLISFITPSFNLNFPFALELCFLFIVLGISFALAGVYSFKKHKTTVNPVSTDNVSTLVNTGIFGYTRNPMYVGMFTTLLGYALLLSNPINLLILIMFILYMNKYQITPEETFLTSTFGNEYVAYKNNVKRWL